MSSHLKCTIIDGTGYFSWRSDLWVSTLDDDHIVYSEYCSFDYCQKGEKYINIVDSVDSQCAFNRAGRLCGGCNTKENFSLAIGSSNCIPCHNNNNMALIIFFAVAGILLVLFIFISNLTVAEGVINGLIFYANIIWTYKSVFFAPTEGTTFMIFLKAFIAWVNLYFGIETCFVMELKSFSKALLQYLFPLYILIIAALIIIAARYSSRLTNLLGNKALPLLATLFLLSYSKLLQNIISCLGFSIIYEHSNVSVYPVRSIVWPVDGNYDYFGWPHILLFLIGLATLIFLFLVCILPLFLMQWLQRVSHLRLLKWITKFHPFYEVYYAPLKSKHHYLFGMLLLVRGILQVMFSSIFAIPQYINLLLLLVIGLLLLHYLAYMQTKIVLINEISFQMNIILLSVFFFFAHTQSNIILKLQAASVGISTGIAFLQFCGILLCSMPYLRCFCKRWHPKYRDLTGSAERPSRIQVNDFSNDYRDSILNESQSLIPTY